MLFLLETAGLGGKKKIYLPYLCYLSIYTLKKTKILAGFGARQVSADKTGVGF